MDPILIYSRSFNTFPSAKGLGAFGKTSGFASGARAFEVLPE
jgi:hypothetical protein